MKLCHHFTVLLHFIHRDTKSAVLHYDIVEAQEACKHSRSFIYTYTGLTLPLSLSPSCYSSKGVSDARRLTLPLCLMCYRVQVGAVWQLVMYKSHVVLDTPALSVLLFSCRSQKEADSYLTYLVNKNRDFLLLSKLSAKSNTPK